MRQLVRFVRRRLSRFAAAASFSSASPSAPSPSSAAASCATPRLLRLGDVLSLARCFSETDVALYSELTGDRNPAHLDDAFARAVSGFAGGRVVHGMLVASLFPSVVAAHFPGAVYVSQTLKFKKPVYIDDKVRAELRATYLRQNKDKYIAKFATQCFTNEESPIIDGEATAILPTLNVKEDQ